MEQSDKSGEAGKRPALCSSSLCVLAAGKKVKGSRLKVKKLGGWEAGKLLARVIKIESEIGIGIEGGRR